MFQVISRNNDVNGNPYRLVLVYNMQGGVDKAYEARSSSPNICNKLSKEIPQLPSVHVSPSEYNQFKKAFKDVLEYVD